MNWSLRTANFFASAVRSASDGWPCFELERCEIISVKRAAQASVMHRLGIGSPFNGAAALEIFVRTEKSELQRLKPLAFCAVYVVAKATTHKDSQVLIQTLQPRLTKILEL